MKISEYVSLGHPDKIADYISEYVLDRFIEKDPNTKYAVEVQIKDNFVSLGGEIKSSCTFTNSEIENFVREAVNDIGYTKEYQNKWGKENTICGDDLIVSQHIGMQSPDINKGLSGWGDQGIMFGLATNTEDFMSKDYSIAKTLAQKLFNSKLGGLDIKTLVQTSNEGVVEKIVVAIPLLTYDHSWIEDVVRDTCSGDYELIINGTGIYEIHSSIADCGTTGRKLAVDFYGGNSVIGGGSPWTKDGSKADLTLNLYAREKALKFLKESNYKLKSVKSSIACCIGKKEINVEVRDEKDNLLYCEEESISPKCLIERYQLNKPIFASLCKNGLFSIVDKLHS